MLANLSEKGNSDGKPDYTNSRHERQHTSMGYNFQLIIIDRSRRTSGFSEGLLR